MADIRNRQMDDPEGLVSRVFVGNLPLDADRETIMAKFGAFGPVMGVMVLKGFAFVQFDKESDSKIAIEQMNGTEFLGKIIDVKKAKHSGKGSDMMPINNGNYPNESPWDGVSGSRGGFKGNSRGGGYPNKRARGGGPWQSERFGKYPDFHEDINEDDYNEMTEMEKFNDRLNSDAYDEDDRRFPRAGRRDFRSENNDLDQRRGPGRFDNDRWGRERGTSWQRDRPEMERGHSSPPPPQVPQRNRLGGPASCAKSNDVEIICIGRAVTDYAEHIEGRMKKMGLAVDVLFPNSDIPIGKVLGSIASRGVKYGACVGAEHKATGTVTLTVLQGEQQEHRNMPIDDAMAFISRNFSTHMSSSTANKSSSSGDTLSGSNHPEDIRMILGFLTANRPLSVMEYDKILRYLTAQRHALLKTEYGENIPSALAIPPVQDPALRTKQEALQNRVLSILTRTKEQIDAPSAVKPTPPINPSLQAAIDSLVKTGPNLLNSLKSREVKDGTQDFYDSYSQMAGGDHNQGYEGFGNKSSDIQQDEDSHTASGRLWSDGSHHGSGYGSQGGW